jgi:host factor-I protein
MSKSGLNLQDSFLNQVRRESISLRITLMNGQEFSGRVKGFDNFTLVVVSEANEYHLIYKHGIAQMVSSKPIHGAATRKGSPSGIDSESGSEEQLDQGEEQDSPSPASAPELSKQPEGAGKKSGFNTLRFDGLVDLTKKAQ